jgi:hypothetical protein
VNEKLLSLRLPKALERQLARAAAERDVAKSLLVREAVAAYLGTRPSSEAVHVMRASEVVRLWESLPSLTSDERAAFADDIAEARRGLREPADPWE